jgi:hypothetical protein
VFWVTAQGSTHFTVRKFAGDHNSATSFPWSVAGRMSNLVCVRNTAGSGGVGPVTRLDRAPAAPAGHYHTTRQYCRCSLLVSRGTRDVTSSCSYRWHKWRKT